MAGAVFGKIAGMFFKPYFYFYITQAKTIGVILFPVPLQFALVFLFTGNIATGFLSLYRANIRCIIFATIRTIFFRRSVFRFMELPLP